MLILGEGYQLGEDSLLKRAALLPPLLLVQPHGLLWADARRQRRGDDPASHLDDGKLGDPGQRTLSSLGERARAPSLAMVAIQRLLGRAPRRDDGLLDQALVGLGELRSASKWRW